jgi:hypothetical protein
MQALFILSFRTRMYEHLQSFFKPEHVSNQSSVTGSVSKESMLLGNRVFCR